MTDELLIQIALRAMQDDDALPVLQDAILESGYTDFNVANLSVKLGYLVTEAIANNYASAVAAFLLFSGWPTSWPLANRCRYVHFIDWKLEIRPPQPNMRISIRDALTGGTERG